MAQSSKRKHGKVEARKTKPLVRFKLGILLLLIAISFGGCFTLHILSATAQPDYWEKEIIGSTEATEPTDAEDTADATTSAAINPVPASERADDSYLSACVFIGDVSAFTTYHGTASGMVYADAVFAVTEDELAALAAKAGSQNAAAVYLWPPLPEDETLGLASMETLLEALQKHSTAPLYLLTTLPDSSRERNLRADAWNASLLQLADRMDVHYVDISTPLKRNDGLPEAAYDRTDAAWKRIGETILTHIAE